MRREFPAKIMVAAFERAAGLTADRLRELLHYDPDTGVFTRRTTRGRFKAGAPSGYLSAVGYFQIRVDQKLYYAHRLAWLYVHDHWPTEMTDHIDGDRTNNRIANLREATRQQNAQNSGNYSRTTSGLKGTLWIEGRRKWRASIGIDGRTKFIGYYATPEEAHSAYKAAAEAAFGEFAR